MNKEIESDVETSTKPKIKKSLSLDKVKTEMVKEIAESILQEELEESDETDRIFKDKVEDIIETFAAENEDKKSFISSLVKIFSILLTKRCNTLTKIKKAIKLATETALQLWPKQKLQ